MLYQLHSDTAPTPSVACVNPIVHWEIAVPDMEAGQEFYTNLCAWSFWSLVSDTGFAVAEEGGLPLGISLYHTTHIGTTTYVQVDSLDATLERARSAGGQTLVGPSPFPGGGRFALTEGVDSNRMGLYEPPPSA